MASGAVYFVASIGLSKGMWFMSVPSRVAARLLIASVLVSAGATNAHAQLRGVVYVSGLSVPVAMVQDPAFPSIQYVVEQTGRIRIVQNGVLQGLPLIDLSGEIRAGGEEGLLGMAFPPLSAGSTRFYINYTSSSGNVVVERVTRSVTNPFSITARRPLVWGSGLPYIPHPAGNHKGGHLAFGPDGYLYIGLGDGGGANDQFDNAQTPGSLLGKMLRIDVNVPDSNAQGYVIPADNPFLDGIPVVALPEIWAFGLRNPWRYSFDDGPGGTGALIVGDVGQGQREEIDYELKGPNPANWGRNYGWPYREGVLDYLTGRHVAFQPLTDPIFDYPRSVGQAITGGFVYRGTALPPFYRGRYFFADFVQGRVFSLRLTINGQSVVANDLLEHTAELSGNAALGAISSFGRDSEGELYVVSYAGSLVRIVAPSPDRVSLLDLNGDHRLDALLYDRETGSWSVQFATGAGTFTAGPSGGWSAGWDVYPANFDADALSDLFLHNPVNGYWCKVLNNGAASFTYFCGGWLPQYTPYIADLNGDGRSDVFLYDATATGTWLKSLSVGNGRTGFTYLAGGWRPGWQLHLADFDANGLADFFLFNPANGTWFKAVNDGGAGFTYFSGGWLTGYTVHVVDLNGDGRSDVFLHNETSGHWFKAISTGGGTMGFDYQTGGWATGWIVTAANFDGGAATDFLLYNPTSGSFFKVVNDGVNFSYIGGGWARWRTATGDFTGDGRTDVLLLSTSDNRWVVAATSTPGAFTYTSGWW